MVRTVMTFNLRVDVASDGPNAWPHRARAAAQAVLASGADIVCTQEGTLSMLRELEAELPAFRRVGDGRLGGQEGEYTAIFYRSDVWTLLDSGNFGLSEFPEKPGFLSWDTSYPRMCTWLTATDDRGRRLTVFNTHLDHISEEARRCGMALIVERMEARRAQSGGPIVLGGDFNCGPDREAHPPLRRAGYASVYDGWGAEHSVGATFHNFQGGVEGEPIDYLYASPDVRIRSARIDRDRYDGRYPSDHYPVIAEIEY